MLGTQSDIEVGVLLAIDAHPFGPGIAEGCPPSEGWDQDLFHRGHDDRVGSHQPPLEGDNENKIQIGTFVDRINSEALDQLQVCC